jgi:hypothetical protein
LPTVAEGRRGSGVGGRLARRSANRAAGRSGLPAVARSAEVGSRLAHRSAKHGRRWSMPQVGLPAEREARRWEVGGRPPQVGLPAEREARRWVVGGADCGGRRAEVGGRRSGFTCEANSRDSSSFRRLEAGTSEVKVRGRNVGPSRGRRRSRGYVRQAWLELARYP